MRTIVILIPAYNPEQRLVNIVRELAQRTECPIVVVNDGSDAGLTEVFESIGTINGAEVVLNAINLGKGAALKHGINFALTHFPNVQGVVTADADGQHAIGDIVAVVEELRANPKCFVLGARKFGPETPFRSKIGNEVSRVVYRVLLGLRLRDTQTGLRGLPLLLAAAALTIRSNRYEFETEQLTLAAAMRLPIREVPIANIYENQNSSSHFNPIFDSARIYFVVIRYALSSIATSLIDLAAFLVLNSVLPSVIWSNLASRAVALGVQYLLLQGFVFHSYSGVGRFLLFIGYVALTGLVSGVLQSELSAVTALSAVSSKVVVETTIFVFNFLFLRDIMFSRSKDDAKSY